MLTWKPACRQYVRPLALSELTLRGRRDQAVHLKPDHNRILLTFYAPFSPHRQASQCSGLLMLHRTLTNRTHLQASVDLLRLQNDDDTAVPLKCLSSQERSPMLRGIDMPIQSGKMVVFVGPSGADKTTLTTHMRPHDVDQPPRSRTWK